MFPVEVRENNAAENASGNLFAFGQRPTIGIFHGIGGRDRSGYLHRQIHYKMHPTPRLQRRTREGCYSKDKHLSRKAASIPGIRPPFCAYGK